MIFIWLKMQTYGNRLTAVFKWETVWQWVPKHLFFCERLKFIILSLFFFVQNLEKILLAVHGDFIIASRPVE